MLVQFIKNIIGTSVANNEVKAPVNGRSRSNENKKDKGAAAEADTFKMHPQRYWASPNFFFNSNMFS